MTIFWQTVTPTWSSYREDLEYLTDPSVDLVERFRREIVTYEDPSKHPAYEYCDDVERSKGLMLFVLMRVEVLIKPDKDAKKLYFVKCTDI